MSAAANKYLGGIGEWGDNSNLSSYKSSNNDDDREKEKEKKEQSKAIGGNGTGSINHTKNNIDEDRLEELIVSKPRQKESTTFVNVEANVNPILGKELDVTKFNFISTVPTYPLAKSVILEGNPHFEKEGKETEWSPTNLFRNPSYLMSLLGSQSGFVVYVISAHGTVIDSSKMKMINKIPYAVVQPGANDSVGCNVYFGAQNMLFHLFSHELLFTFQYLLGLHNDSLPPLFNDLFYSTTDLVEDGFTNIKPTPEILPERILSYGKDDSLMGAGIYLFDPDKKTKNKGEPIFEKQIQFDRIFYSRYGLLLSQLIEIILNGRRLDDKRPVIFALLSCSSFPEGTTALAPATVSRIIRESGMASFYSHSHVPSDFPTFGFGDSTIPSIVNPAYSKYNFYNPKKVSNIWRTAMPAIPVQNYFTKTLASATDYLESEIKEAPLLKSREKIKLSKRTLMNKKKGHTKTQKRVPAGKIKYRFRQSLKK